MAWFVWQNSDLKQLRALTANESRWRRIFAILFLFAIVLTVMGISAFLGVSVVEYVRVGKLPELKQIRQMQLETWHIIAAVILMAVAMPLCVAFWKRTMEKSHFISNVMVQRILRFGPY